MRKKLKKKGYDTLNSETAIIPIMVRNEVLLTEISKEFLKRGIIVNYIFPPVVSPGKSRIRVSMMATHTKDDMDYFLTIFDEIDRDYKIR